MTSSCQLCTFRPLRPLSRPVLLHTSATLDEDPSNKSAWKTVNPPIAIFLHPSYSTFTLLATTAWPTLKGKLWLICVINFDISKRKKLVIVRICTFQVSFNKSLFYTFQTDIFCIFNKWISGYSENDIKHIHTLRQTFKQTDILSRKPWCPQNLLSIISV